MEWLNSKWMYVLLVVLVVIIGIMLYQYNSCRDKGKASGKAFKCGMFSRSPVSILPIEEYYDLSGGECYHYIDYGDRMSIKKVGMEKCN